MADEPRAPTIMEQLDRCAANPEGPQPTALLALAGAIGEALAHIVHYNLKRYPDIVSDDDPRLLEMPPAPEPAPVARWVYFMVDGATDLIKVGISTDVMTRRGAVSRKVKHKLVVAGSVRGDFATEARFHKLLAAHRSDNEWFRRGPWFDEVLAGLDAGENADALIGRITAVEQRYG